MSNCPHVEDAFLYTNAEVLDAGYPSFPINVKANLLSSCVHPKLYARSCTRNVDLNLMPYLLIKTFASSGK